MLRPSFGMGEGPTVLGQPLGYGWVIGCVGVACLAS